MKYLFAIAFLVSSIGAAHAQAYGSGVDGQSVFRVSQTTVINTTSTAALSPKMASDTRVVRLSCTQDCHFRMGRANVVATTSNSILFGGATEYFKLNATGPNYISVIRATADGKLVIDEMLP